jgi:hypothetical protein
MLGVSAIHVDVRGPPLLTAVGHLKAFGDDKRETGEEGVLSSLSSLKKQNLYF